VLDASGSMNARPPNGETRIEVARRAVKGRWCRPAHNCRCASTARNRP
jgi:hypothetical protein